MNWSEFVGIPFVNLGRDEHGCDCYGLLCYIYKKRREIILKDYTDLQYTCEEYGTEAVENHILTNWESDWVIVDPPYRIYDALLFYNMEMTMVTHLGMFIGSKRFIHSIEGKDSMISKLPGHWDSRLYRVFRYKGG